VNPRLPQWLSARLARALPGLMVGSRFEPTPRRGRHYDQCPADARQAAVLLLLYPHRGTWHVPLTIRPADLPDHPGQISLPGGALAPGETAAAAAVREFHEELGAEGAAIELVGRLSPIYIHASNFRVEPWVGTSPARPAMTPNPAEVAELLEVPLAHLAEAANFACHPRTDAQGNRFTAPHFAWQSHRIWGATCMILGELVTILEELDEPL
jgi:8-oxo-dGTP pyrophosphatase MutT (NUDIX family)